VGQFEFRYFARFGRSSARKEKIAAPKLKLKALAMFERGRRLMPKQINSLLVCWTVCCELRVLLMRNLKAHVDTPLHSPNEWILKGFHSIAMGGRIM
jgi:hypothetical protein